MTKRDRMGHDLTGLEEYESAAEVTPTPEDPVYLLPPTGADPRRTP